MLVKSYMIFITTCTALYHFSGFFITCTSPAEGLHFSALASMLTHCNYTVMIIEPHPLIQGEWVLTPRGSYIHPNELLIVDISIQRP